MRGFVRRMRFFESVFIVGISDSHEAKMKQRLVTMLCSPASGRDWRASCRAAFFLMKPGEAVSRLAS